jgi:hypothetical protein
VRRCRYSKQKSPACCVRPAPGAGAAVWVPTQEPIGHALVQSQCCRPATWAAAHRAVSRLRRAIDLCAARREPHRHTHGATIALRVSAGRVDATVVRHCARLAAVPICRTPKSRLEAHRPSRLPTQLPGLSPVPLTASIRRIVSTLSDSTEDLETQCGRSGPQDRAALSDSRAAAVVQSVPRSRPSGERLACSE